MKRKRRMKRTKNPVSVQRHAFPCAKVCFSVSQRSTRVGGAGSDGTAGGMYDMAASS